MTWLSSAASWAGKNIGNIVKGAGSILSFIPGVGQLVGPAVMSAGGALQAKQTGTIDIVTTATNQLVKSQAVANNMTSAGIATLSASPLTTWIKNNLLIVFGIIVVVGYFLLKRKHRR